MDAIELCCIRDTGGVRSVLVLEKSPLEGREGILFQTLPMNVEAVDGCEVALDASLSGVGLVTCDVDSSGCIGSAEEVPDDKE